MSETEPELGLGTVVAAGGGRIDLRFHAPGESRSYALEGAPLRRVRLREGDELRTRDGATMTVESVAEDGPLLGYVAAGEIVVETELADDLVCAAPDERLLGGHLDGAGQFDLRSRALEWRARVRRSAVRGLVGGRVELIPHQISVAEEVANRLAPRALLADEVGLGKTIEACLILQRLHRIGRADRVLVLVPEPLVHQWFVELLRRFNLRFSIFDEDRCRAIESGDPEANPFLDDQLALAATGWAAGAVARAAQLADAAWDLVVIDEAHHLEPAEGEAGAAYRLAGSLAVRADGLLLLTATPEAHGDPGHFARLRLIDPDRYGDLEHFQAEQAAFHTVADLVDALVDGGDPDPEALRELAGRSGSVARLAKVLGLADGVKGKGKGKGKGKVGVGVGVGGGGHGDRGRRRELADALIDEFGPGRAVFRNTRDRVAGFPERDLHVAELPAPVAVPASELAPEPGPEPESHPERASPSPPPVGAGEPDPRAAWLAGFLAGRPGEKSLVICRSRELAEEVVAYLQRETAVKCGVFHEGLTIIQRDRNAAYFAEADGAQVLVCSEIGSEGRNFQFARHLVLFDLPHDPELLEQRIGRLDRIGHSGAVRIHVPVVEGSEESVLVAWFRDGFGSFERPVHGAAEIASAVQAELGRALQSRGAAEIEALVAATRSKREEVTQRLAEGADRLLGRQSSRPTTAAERIAEIRGWDGDAGFAGFLLDALEGIGVSVEPLDARRVLLRPDNLVSGDLPGLPDEGATVTFDRSLALAREDIGFVTPDHPMVQGAFDLLLGGVAGTASVGFRDAPPGRGQALHVEFLFVAECVADARLHVDRFLPATPVRVSVDHELTVRVGAVAAGAGADDGPVRWRKGDSRGLIAKPVFRQQLFPAAVAKAREVAHGESVRVIAEAADGADHLLNAEISRLEDLRQRNPHVTGDEIRALGEHRDAVLAAIRSARLRLDSVRVVVERPGG